jgi:hypothetical protein
MMMEPTTTLSGHDVQYSSYMKDEPHDTNAAICTSVLFLVLVGIVVEDDMA